jgi:hypothetical protein
MSWSDAANAVAGQYIVVASANAVNILPITSSPLDKPVLIVRTA